MYQIVSVYPNVSLIPSDTLITVAGDAKMLTRWSDPGTVDRP